MRINIYPPAKKSNLCGPHKDHKMGSTYDTHKEEQRHVLS